MRLTISRKAVPYLSLLLIPVTLLLEYLHADPVLIFIASAAAIVPLAWFMGRATESLSATMGAGIGGFLNATFGNAAELIIALMALREGLYDVVKASITGSIVGNILLILGISFLAGGLRFDIQTFNPTAAGMGSTLLLLSIAGLVVPAAFHYLLKGVTPAIERDLSLEISIVLFATYLLSLIFSLKTHRDLFGGKGREEPDWGRGMAVTVLLASTLFVVLMGEILISTLKPFALRLGVTDTFLGVVLVAIVGNAAEHSTAVVAAIKNKMDLSVTIAIGSSIQIALFVAPVLVFSSYLLGRPMDLVFTPFEIVSLSLSVLILDSVASDGESHWMEGVMLISTYLILAIAFYLLPA